jgi:hypothetical protein
MAFLILVMTSIRNLLFLAGKLKSGNTKMAKQMYKHSHMHLLEVDATTENCPHCPKTCQQVRV